MFQPMRAVQYYCTLILLFVQLGLFWPFFVKVSPARLQPSGHCPRRPKASTMPALSTFDFEAVKDYTCCLHLDGQSYTGTIPTEIGLMSNLEDGFYLSRNALTGTIPTQIGMLTELRSDFVLSDNSLTGSIPSQVYLMSKLTSNFDVSYNSLTGHIPKIALQYLTDMKDTFKLDHNQFSGTIPSEIGLLTKMTDKLELDNNYLCGTIPEEVSELTDLTGYFSMYGNSLCGEVPTILQSGAASVQHWAYTEGTYVNQTCQEVCEQGGDEELLGIGVGGVVGIVLAILLLLGACFAFAWSQGSLGSAGGSGGSSKEGRRQAAQQFEDAKSPMMNEAAAYEPPKAAPSAPNEF